MTRNNKTTNEDILSGKGLKSIQDETSKNNGITVENRDDNSIGSGRRIDVFEVNKDKENE